MKGGHTAKTESIIMDDRTDENVESAKEALSELFPSAEVKVHDPGDASGRELSFLNRSVAVDRFSLRSNISWMLSPEKSQAGYARMTFPSVSTEKSGS